MQAKVREEVLIALAIFALHQRVLRKEHLDLHRKMPKNRHFSKMK